MVNLISQIFPRLPKCRNVTKCFSRSSSSDVKSSDDFMKAWRISSFGQPNNLTLDDIKLPSIKNPNEVIIKVVASSVNPIDVAMLGGYGNVILDMMRKVDPKSSQVPGLPLTLGRDFAGEVLAKGSKVRADILVGDIVYGVIPPHNQGCHAQIAIADESLLVRKPDNLSIEEASAVLYAGLTAWSSLKVTGDLLLTDSHNKRALVIGGCGGVGHIAVQLLKAWGAEVTSTCKQDGIPMLEKFNVDNIVDYSGRDHMHQLNQIGKFDIILDASGAVDPTTYVPMLKDWCNAKFISLRSPMLKNTDSYGILAGMAKNATDFVTANISSGAAKKGSSIRWGFFLPIKQGVNEIANLVAERKVMPVIEQVFDFNNVPAAYELMNAGHRRGKIVVKM